MKNNFTIQLKGLLKSTSALAILLSMTAGSSFAQVNRYGSFAPMDRSNGTISAMATHCVKVNQLSNDRITDTEATLSWNPNITADAFKVVYTSISTGISNEVTMGPGNSSILVQGLAPAEQYKWFVESICASGNHISSMMKFSTLAPIVPRPVAGAYQDRIINSNPAPMCTPIGTVTMLDMGYNKAIISWARTFTYDSIIVRWALAGTTQYKTITIPGAPNSGRFFLTGLAAQTSYDIWVSTYCNAAYSTWSSPITVTTLKEPAPRYAAPGKSNNFNLVPNPASVETSIQFECENAGTVLMNIYDITGKEIYTSKIAASEGQNVIAHDLSGMYKGIYFVKLSGNNVSSVQRLIVQ